jgi:hypothetical protein
MSNELSGSHAWRERLFSLSIPTAVLSGTGTVICWANPFPLTAHDGGYSINPWDDRVFVATLLLSVLTAILGCFGRRAPRVVLAAAGVILFFLSYFGWLGTTCERRQSVSS